jgi:hypothetical protein
MDPSIAMSWHIPHISISLAPPEEAEIEPYSPFSSMPLTAGDEDAFRPRHLSPPPTFASFGLEDTDDVEVLGREHSQAPLEASINRDVAISGNKTGGLRKELAYNAHINRHGMIDLFLLVYHL